MIFLAFLFLLFALLLCLFALFHVTAFFFGGPFVPTPMRVINEMIFLAKIDKHDTVYDLGSGDGRMLIASAKKGALARGWDINPFLVLWTKFMARITGVPKNVAVFCQTYQHATLHDATVIFIYNLPSFLPALEKKFQKELKPGTKIISYKFPLKTFKPVNQTPSGIFLYTTSRHSERSKAKSRNLLTPTSTVE